MKLKFIVLLAMVASLGFGAVGVEERASSALKHTIPQDKVLSVSAQQAMFVAAYEEVGAETVDPLKTPIPGLSPLMRMHYSFALKIAEEQGSPKDSIDILSNMWQQVEPSVEAGSITVGQMKAMSYQVAMLLSYVQEQKKPTGLFEAPTEDIFVMHSGMYGQFSPETWWHDLSKFAIETPYQAYNHGTGAMGAPLTAPGFCCEAILCNRGGGFSYRRFLDTYLEKKWPVFLSALSYDTGEKAPHGGIHYHSARFLDHDFTHFNDAIAAFVDHLDSKGTPHDQSISEWEKVRQILTPLYERNTRTNNLALFIFLREDSWGSAYQETGSSEGFLSSFLSDKPDSEKFRFFIEELKRNKGFTPRDRTEEYFREYTEEEYSGFYKDYEHMLGHALGDRFVISDEWPIEKRIQTLGEAMLRFLDSVYDENKDLFEDKAASAVKKPSTEGGEASVKKSSASIAALMKKFEAQNSESSI
jgi:hypothetical protein